MRNKHPTTGSPEPNLGGAVGWVDEQMLLDPRKSPRSYISHFFRLARLQIYETLMGQDKESQQAARRLIAEERAAPLSPSERSALRKRIVPENHRYWTAGGYVSAGPRDDEEHGLRQHLVAAADEYGGGSNDDSEGAGVERTNDEAYKSAERLREKLLEIGKISLTHDAGKYLAIVDYDYELDENPRRAMEQLRLRHPDAFIIVLKVDPDDTPFPTALVPFKPNPQ